MSILVPKQKSIASAAKEIQLYLQEADHLNVQKPTNRYALEKKEAILKVSQFVYSASAVKQMLQEKMGCTKTCNYCSGEEPGYGGAK
jgi:3'-phosphoadenosine 5'-phosphosulfate (PAPS) 3'-phosphatase